ncbi:MAG: adenylosuccinate lyase [Chloroflexi bacterium]|nr:adenylosuccinate lyase [Chloroflexota bacterium]
MSFNHDTFISPLTWRYGSDAMRQIWSENHKRRSLRRVWLALAKAQREAGLVTDVQIADLEKQVNNVDIERAAAIEAEVKHDLVAELHTYAEQCPVGGGALHMGATSADIQDNAEALRLREGLDRLLTALQTVCEHMAEQIERWAHTPAMAFTHIQPAEPTTVGYRLAQYGHDLLLDAAELSRARDNVKGKGLKGAVGTSAATTTLLAGTGWTAVQLETRAMSYLGLEAFPVATQTYTRKQDWFILNALAGLGGTLYKFAFDWRLLQSPVIGEWAEPFGKRQVGSSAMPFKRNPITAEKMNSLARHLASMPRVAWDNAAHSLLERTLDDSANRRLILPEAFLIADELLGNARRLLAELRVDERAVTRNLATYGLFAGSEQALAALSKAGADRLAMHGRIRDHALQAWEAINQGQPNPLADLLATDEVFLRYLSADAIREQLDYEAYLGDAPERALAVAQMLRQINI